MTKTAKKFEAAPFDTDSFLDSLWSSRTDERQGSELTVTFVCPECGGDTLMTVERGVLETTSVKSVNYGSISWGDGILTAPPEKRTFCCAGCGYVLADGDGEPIHHGDELVAWLMSNCPDDKERHGDEREVLVDSHAYFHGFVQTEKSPVQCTPGAHESHSFLRCACPYCGDELLAEILLDLTRIAEIECIRDDGTWETSWSEFDFTDVKACYVCLNCKWPLTDGYGWPIRNEDQLIEYFIEHGE